MTIEQLNEFLKNHENLLKSQLPLFVLMTGASGAGKTYLAKALEEKLDPGFVHIAYFDHIGVPPIEEMVEKFGSGENWQEAMTHKWLQILASKQDKRVIILEGQYRPQFALDACKELGIHNYILVLIHADRKIRDDRLIKHRRQPDLANDIMENWAQFLKARTEELGGAIIDTSASDIQASLNKIAAAIKASLQKIASTSP